jgi:hypothetical protein
MVAFQGHWVMVYDLVSGAALSIALPVIGINRNNSIVIAAIAVIPSVVGLVQGWQKADKAINQHNRMANKIDMLEATIDSLKEVSHQGTVEPQKEKLAQV